MSGSIGNNRIWLIFKKSIQKIKKKKENEYENNKRI